MEKFNPHTEASHFLDFDSKNAVQLALETLAESGPDWNATPLDLRVQTLKQSLRRLEAHKDAIARQITEDMGKPLAAAQAEIDRCLLGGEQLCNFALEWLRPEAVPGGQIYFSALGTSLVISPWNFPVWVPLVGIFSALLGGNAVVFKPSEYALATGLLLSQVLSGEDRTLTDILRTVSGAGDLGGWMVEHPLVHHVIFTGSLKTGSSIAEICGRRLIPCALELGGLDAAIVLKDCDLKSTAEAIVRNNAHNSGQVCCSIKRVFVEAPIYEPFLQAAIATSRSLTLGDPCTDVDMGPLVAAFQLKKVEAALEDAVQHGAVVHSGGMRTQRPGYYYPSTVVTNLKPSATLLQEEAFGPILPIIPVRDWKEAVALANSTVYGLAGSVWTNDTHLGSQIARSLQVGVARINSHGAGPIGAPWEGSKSSGLGRMRSRAGLRECCRSTYIAG
jgi:acyl-CoA reductase-like NAD-dependent aldehyde dehydrogenase